MWNDTAPGRFWLPGPFLIPSSLQSLIPANQSSRFFLRTSTKRVKLSEWSWRPSRITSRP